VVGVAVVDVNPGVDFPNYQTFPTMVSGSALVSVPAAEPSTPVTPIVYTGWTMLTNGGGTNFNAGDYASLSSAGIYIGWQYKFRYYLPQSVTGPFHLTFGITSAGTGNGMNFQLWSDTISGIGYSEIGNNHISYDTQVGWGGGKILNTAFNGSMGVGTYTVDVWRNSNGTLTLNVTTPTGTLANTGTSAGSGNLRIIDFWGAHVTVNRLAVYY
jgi:hypothetical protein